MSESAIAWLNPLYGLAKNKNNNQVKPKLVLPKKNPAMAFVVPVKKQTASSGFYNFFVVMLLVLNFSLLFSYFFAINNYSAKGFELRELGLSVKKLEIENKKNSVQLSERGSIASIKQDLEQAGFVPVLNVEYAGTRRVVER